MNILKKLEAIFHLDFIDVSERVKIVEGKFEVKNSNLPSFEELNSLLKSVPIRDNLKLSLQSDSEDYIRIMSHDTLEQDRYNNFKGIFDHDDIISISLTIEKSTKENKFSIYNFSSFTNDLLTIGTLETMSSFSHLLEHIDHLTFEMFDEDNFFCTHSMAFVPSDRNIKLKNNIRSNRLNSCHDTAYFFNANEYRLLPEDFAFDINFDNNPLTELFERISTLLSLVYISSTATISESNLKIQIS